VVKAEGREQETGRPAVIFLHGGGFIPPCCKRQKYVPVFARALTAAGYVVIAPEYPVFDSAEHREAAALPDRGAALAAEATHRTYEYIQKNADMLGVDPERIGIMGGSAGGFTSFYLLTHYNDAFKFFGNCWGCPPYEMDLSKFPPTISIHGTADQAVSYGNEQPVQEQLERLGIPHKLITLEGAPHTPMKEFDQYIPDVLAWIEKYM